MEEKTLIIIKPDAVQRGLTGKIFERMESRGFKLLAAKFMHISLELARKHYAVHKGKYFFDMACEYLSSSPAMVMVWEGTNVIKLSRNMIGPTDPADAQCGTIRGDYGLTQSYNIIHGSDSRKAAEYEIPLFFTKDEIMDYRLDVEPWLEGKGAIIAMRQSG